MQLSGPVVLFDGVCNFCNRMVNFAIRNDPNARLKFAPLQSETGQTLFKQFGISPDADTLVFIDNNKAYTYARAGIRICRYLRWPVKLLYGLIIIPAFISQPFYKWIARNRYRWFGKKDSCMIPSPDIRDRFLD